MSMDDIASRARVGKAAIYRRWPSKAAVVADAIAHWRRGIGPVEPPNTGSLRGDIDALVAAVPDLDEAEVGTMKVVVGWPRPPPTIRFWRRPSTNWCCRNRAG